LRPKKDGVNPKKDGVNPKKDGVNPKKDGLLFCNYLIYIDYFDINYNKQDKN
jgi:hypothetical protein